MEWFALFHSRSCLERTRVSMETNLEVSVVELEPSLFLYIPGRNERERGLHPKKTKRFLLLIDTTMEERPSRSSHFFFKGFIHASSQTRSFCAWKVFADEKTHVEATSRSTLPSVPWIFFKATDRKTHDCRRSGTQEEGNEEILSTRVPSSRSRVLRFDASACVSKRVLNPSTSHLLPCLLRNVPSCNVQDPSRNSSFQSTTKLVSFRTRSFFVSLRFSRRFSTLRNASSCFRFVSIRTRT